VLDLFCGVGNFTLPLAKLAKSVVGIELGKQMVQNAAVNAKRNNLHNCEFIEADLITGNNLIELLAGKVFYPLRCAITF
jgi:tRNA/tmRNA/rRNA uracil-C5-methylase (TrmA/RlmC/RlmD family)